MGRWRLLLSPVAVAVTVTALLPASTAPLSAPSLGRGDLVPAAAAACVDVLVVGVDGNGEGSGTTPGATVGRIAKRLTAKARATGRTTAVQRVALATPGPERMVRSRRLPTLRALTTNGVRAWRQPVGTGERATRALLDQHLAACPQQQVVLVGYAQGAAVVHRVTQVLASQRRLTNVSGAVLVSDPFRTKRSVAGAPLGNPAAGTASAGVVTKVLRSYGDVPRATPTFDVVSVCHRGDLVCNPNKTIAADALRLARGYSTTRGTRAMVQAAERMWQRTTLWPISTSSRVSVQADVAFSERLTVSGGSPSTPAARWTATTLPDGVRLSADGVLSGRLRTPGTYQVDFTVAGFSPSTPARQASLVITVEAESGGRSAGGMTTCEVRTDGSAWCWGRNDFGQVGDGTTTLRTRPTRVVGDGWARIDTGGGSTCGVKTDGSLWCWGLNNFGQLGGSDKKRASQPRRVGSDTNWRSVSASWTHACATRTDGSLWCWGQNLHGQLGIGKTSSRSDGPLRVAGSRRWAEVSAGEWHTCGVAASGAALCWGNNAFGQVGDGTTALRVKPALVAGGRTYSRIETSWARTCAIAIGGQAWCWGDNTNGELGNGTRADSTTPVGVAGGRSWVALALTNHATCATEVDGQVFCWGDNRYGQLGRASVGQALAPVATGLTSTGAEVAGGWYHFCGGGTCWGANDSGQFGNGTTSGAAMPSEPAPPWGKITRLTDAQVRDWAPRRIARTAIAKRPAVSNTAIVGKDGRRSFAFDLMTFNVLGSQHTSPSGARPAFAPGRVRSEWGKTIVERRGASLVGLSEPQPDQINQFNVATRGAWTFFPGNTQGYDAAPQSVMWKDSVWQYVWADTAQMPFMRKSRPQPVVRLRHRTTGREIYMINAHLSPGNMQADRDKGLAIIVELVKLLKGDNLPVIVTGDLNEHALAFRKIACGTWLDAAIGGRSSGGACDLPKGMRVDWIFGGRGSFSRTVIDTSSRVRRTTDHAVVSSRFSVQ